MSRGIDLEVTDYFVLRTPLLPFRTLEEWGRAQPAAGIPDPQRAWLGSWSERPEVREALLLASPDLQQGLSEWRRDPDGSGGRSAERSMVRYAARMAGRPTPFGLFAGFTVGRFEDATDMELGPRSAYRRSVHLDFQTLEAVCSALVNDPAVRERVRFEPNPTLYAVAERLHYVESRQADGHRTHQLVAVDSGPAVTAVLERAHGGATVAELAGELCDDEVTREEATAFVEEMISSQILVCEIAPCPTARDPLDRVIGILRRRLGEHPAVGRLADLAGDLRALDRQPLGLGPEIYERLVQRLEGLVPPQPPARTVQVDLLKSAAKAPTLTRFILDDLVQAIEAFSWIPDQNSHTELLDSFMRDFSERYGDREIPLVEALDEEIGIGYPSRAAASSGTQTLLSGLPLPVPEAEIQPFGPYETWLVRRVHEALIQGESEIVLDPDEIRRHGTVSRKSLPDSLSAWVAIAAASAEAVDRQDYRLLVHGFAGPSSARTFGRLCASDEELREHVLRDLQVEESHDPDAVFAEVVHLPEGRTGNILRCPALRQHEIPLLASSAVEPQDRIPLTDLLLSVRDGRIRLRSHRLGREVLPRLTHAHSFWRRSLGIYQFLGALQYQGRRSPLCWSWGPLQKSRFLPRVRLGRLVLEPATWNFEKADLSELEADGPALCERLETWRARHRLPRFVVLVEGSAELPIDLDHALWVRALLRGRKQVVLKEMYPPPDELFVQGPEGRFVHELIVPLRRRVEPRRPTGPVLKASETEIDSRFAPGSRWLYLKVYSGSKTADRLLLGPVAELIEQAREQSWVDRWFFIRYVDRGRHLRLRFHGRPEALLGSLLPRAHELFRPWMQRGLVWRLGIDTYDREVDRYGGPEAMTLAEEIFWHDSSCVVELLRRTPEPDRRWHFGARAIDQLFRDLGWDPSTRRSAVHSAFEGYSLEFGTDTSFRRAVGTRYREVRATVTSCLDANAEDPLWGVGARLLDRRSDRCREAIGRLRRLGEAGRLSRPLADIGRSLAHMSINRLLSEDQRLQELVLYDFLDRIYQARAARERQPAVRR